MVRTAADDAAAAVDGGAGGAGGAGSCSVDSRYGFDAVDAVVGDEAPLEDGGDGKEDE